MGNSAKKRDRNSEFRGIPAEFRRISQPSFPEGHSNLLYGTVWHNPQKFTEKKMEKLVKHFTQFMSTFEVSLPRNSISKYFTQFATPFFLPHLSVLSITMSHFYCTTIILPVPLQNHFSNTSPKLQVI